MSHHSLFASDFEVEEILKKSSKVSANYSDSPIKHGRIRFLFEQVGKIE